MLHKHSNGIWYIDITTEKGKRIRRTTKTKDKKLAEEYHDKVKHELWRLERLGEKPKYLWDDAVLKWINEKADVKKSMKSDLSRLRNLQELRGLYLHEINRNLIMSIINARKCSNSTKNRYIALVRSILNACVKEWDMLDQGIHLKLFKEPKKRVRWLRVEEASRLLKCLEELAPYMATMARFNLATGLRQRNIFSLKWNQIDMRNQTCQYYPDEMKGGEPYDLVLNETAMEILIGQLGKHNEYVFVQTRGKPVLSLTYKTWYKALRTANITDFRWHDLRHTWASWLVQNGVSLYELKEMGGWQSLEMVQKYAHLDNDHLHAHATKIDSLMQIACQKNGKNINSTDYSLKPKQPYNLLNLIS